MSTTTAFRPRSVTEIVDAAIQVVRRNYLPLITVVAAAYVPFLVLQMTAFRTLLAAATNGQFFQMSGAQLMAYYTVSILWFALIDSAVIVASADAYLGRPVDVASTFRRALPRIGATAAAILIKFLAIGFSAVVFIVPAFYVIALFYAVPCTTVLERVGPIAGLKRSAQLSRGLKGHILLTLILVYGLYFILIGGASIIFAMIGNRVAIQAFSAVATVLVYPFVPTVQMLLYYDARIRKEGYDIELMAQGVAAPGATQPA